MDYWEHMQTFTLHILIGWSHKKYNVCVSFSNNNRQTTALCKLWKLLHKAKFEYNVDYWRLDDWLARALTCTCFAVSRFRICRRHQGIIGNFCGLETRLSEWIIRRIARRLRMCFSTSRDKVTARVILFDCRRSRERRAAWLPGAKVAILVGYTRTRNSSDCLCREHSPVVVFYVSRKQRVNSICVHKNNNLASS